MATARSILKNWFSRGKKPTGKQFSDLINSFWHKDEILNTGIQKTYDTKALMLADSNPVNDTTGELLNVNDMVVISNPNNQADPDNGSIWAWKGNENWAYLGTVSNMEAMEFTNDFFETINI